jgi:hypothetical protein
MTGKHDPVVFDVLADLADIRVFKNRAKAIQDGLYFELSHLRVIVTHGNIEGLIRLKAERKAREFCLHGIDIRGFGIQGKKLRRPEAVDEPGQFLFIQNHPVLLVFKV